jgi:putative membrane protein
MFWYNSYYWGMNLLWWMFWAVMLIVILAYATPVSRPRRGSSDPRLILQRQYAAGDIDTEEYERRRAVLEGDGRPPSPSDASSTSGAVQAQ